MSRGSRAAVLGIALLCLPQFLHAVSHTNNNSLGSALLAADARDRDYNNTLHDPYLKHQVLNLADLLANAGLLSATGYVRDHKQRKYVFITDPPLDLRIGVKQSRKIRRMGQAMQRTLDDDYKLAGGIMVALADRLAIADGPGAKRQVLLLEEYYSGDLKKHSNKTAQDNEQLRGIADEVMTGVWDVLNQYSLDIQAKALRGLNLDTILGGTGNALK